jgi:hypothetical protein
MQNFLPLEYAKREGGHMKVCTKGPKAGYLASEGLYTMSRALDSFNSHSSRPIDKCCTSVDGRWLPSADVDALPIRGDTW